MLHWLLCLWVALGITLGQSPVPVEIQFDPTTLNFESPKLHKCCGGDQVFDIDASECVPLPQSGAVDYPDYSLEPTFLSHHYSEGYDYYPDTPFQLYNEPNLPSCSNQEDLNYLSNAQNNHQQGQYAIDDLNVTGKHYILLDVAGSGTYGFFCVDKSYFDGKFQGTVAVFCQTKPEFECENQTCINFCCPYQQVFRDGRCVDPISLEFAPLPIFEADGETPSKKPRNEFKFLSERIPRKCKFFMYEDFAITEDGDAQVYQVSYASEQYCVEREETYDNGTDTFVYPFKIVVCQPDDPTKRGYLRYVEIVDFTIIPTFFVISLIFLGLLFVHVCRRNRHKLFGVMTLCLISMLFFFYVFLIIAKAFTSLSDYPGLCVLLALLLQYSYLSAILWLNAMGFDIWTTFRRMQNISDPHQATGWRHKRFKFYAMYSWGAPFVVVLVTILMQEVTPSPGSPIIYPGIGVKRCFLAPGWPTVVYLHIIILPILIFNVLFFISSTWNLCCGIWADKSGDPVLRAQNKTKYKTVVKMFFAMGITWIAEQISFLLESIYHPSEVKYFTTVFKVINSLQGFIMFCVIFFDTQNIEWIRVKVFRRPPRQPSQRRSTVSEPRTSTTSGSFVSFRKISKILNQSLRTHAPSHAGRNRPKPADEETLELRDGAKSPI